METQIQNSIERISCKLNFRELQSSVSLESLSQVLASKHLPAVVGGNASRGQGERFSYWAAHPRETYQFVGGHDPFDEIDQLLVRYSFASQDESAPLEGMMPCGWIGYFGYELGRFVERIPETTTDDLQMPFIQLNFYDRVIAFDHHKRKWWLLALEIEGDCESAQSKLAELESWMREADQVRLDEMHLPDMENVNLDLTRCNITREYYLETIDKIRKHIYDGDVYQVNFSQRFDCDYFADPVKLFHWQNRFNPSPYAAFLDIGSHQIVSASPELYIALQDRVIRTKPIKGTRPRYTGEDVGSAAANLKNREELIHSEKDQAELNMIIDLERNDLGRICEYGTIKVIQPREVEEYPTVFHAVATVAGKLRQEISFSDILKGMFPGGSITGAPKVASMEMIDRYEPTARGVYTGSIGTIGVDGSSSLNIAIRTIVIRDGVAYAQTGGGIVADSNAQAEWDETITKARALLAGIFACAND